MGNGLARRAVGAAAAAFVGLALVAGGAPSVVAVGDASVSADKKDEGKNAGGRPDSPGNSDKGAGSDPGGSQGGSGGGNGGGKPDKGADPADKQAEKDRAKADAEEAAQALMEDQSTGDTEDALDAAQAEAKATFQSKKNDAQSTFADAKKGARQAYLAALAEADEAETQEERLALRKAARDEYAAAKKENRLEYLATLKDARRYNGKAQIIYFEPPAEVGQYDDPVAIAAVSSSGLEVVITSSTPDVCQVEDGFLIPGSTGDCALVASQEGGEAADGGKYAPAELTATVVIVDQPDPQEISVSAPTSVAVGSEFVLTVETSSGLPATATSSSPTVCSVAGLTVSALTEGSCVIAVSQAGDETWQTAETSATVTVTAAPSVE